jgi:hypothetical protein
VNRLGIFSPFERLFNLTKNGKNNISYRFILQKNHLVTLLWGQCYDYKNIFAKQLGEKIGKLYAEK